MEYSRVFHREFERDISSTMEWYESHQYGLSAKFLANVRAAVELICQDPTRFTVTRQELRYLSVKKFPYIIIYRVSDSTIYFLGVFHTSRDLDRIIKDSKRS
ncbi:MAG TPA: hypothetical protein DD473_04695 [Planctomycetaceae bacterium]|nr:hypothetical protein [Planctomycetaceae bacterium]|tara:strand:- start:171 stop:476 length:306 start_codon:yes stop_codon:yes gene_type:complete